MFRSLYTIWIAAGLILVIGLGVSMSKAYANRPQVSAAERIWAE